VSGPVRTLNFDDAVPRPDSHLEWLVTNGLGGYACGTVAGSVTRRYHGLLNAALPAPLGRTHYVSHVRASLHVDGCEWVIDHEDGSRLAAPDVARLESFALETGLPVWRYRAGTVVLEKRVVMKYRTNISVVRYRLSGASGECRLVLTPLFQIRPHDSQVTVVNPDDLKIDTHGPVWQLSAGPVVPAVQLTIAGATPRADLRTPLHAALDYGVERERGYAHAGVLWYPGSLEVTIANDRNVDLVCSTGGTASIEAIDTDAIWRAEEQRRESLLARAGSPRSQFARELVLAADAFLIMPVGRQQDIADARRAGDRSCTVIAGYHWFTDWGRDTMISLEGLTLCTGRHQEAADILRTFARHVRDGLIPNLFPEGEQEGLYHTADATLWFVHAIDRYLAHTGDHSLLAELLPTVTSVIEHHLRGTHFGIHVDPQDGLLTQGAAHYQLTWMDAKAGDWVVTPRRGKAVEINALWYNALRLTERWHRESGDPDTAARYGEAADLAHTSFNRRFWNPKRNCLFDVVDGEQGNDDACRPNQVLAISLPHPVLAPDHWPRVVTTVRDVLLTPVGLRSLAPDDPDYQRRYFGDLLTRDAAYHQGTVWAWLAGPFVDAWLKTYPDDPGGAHRALEGFEAHLSEACVGSISEIFDAEAPFTPRGCVAQAWSVAEVLRVSRLL
jgi:predicted glycogen debranching enzyme